MTQAQCVSGVSLAGLLQGHADVPAAQDVSILGLGMDSRALGPGFLFLACRGHDHHGLKHLADARARGAAAVAYDPVDAAPYLKDLAGLPAAAVSELAQQAGGIAARFYADPSATLKVLAVTGTNGKTSVSLISAQVLSESGGSCGVLGTVGFGLYGKLESATHTTPDAVNTQAWLARFRAQGVKQVSMEASSHALQQGRLNGVHLEVAVFTNLTRDHLDYHGSMADYGAAKYRLFEMPGLRHAVINLDDDYGRELAARLPADIDSIGYSLEGRENSAGRTLHGTQLALNAGGLTFDVNGDFGRGHVDSRLLGRFNAQNLLAVLGGLLALGQPFDQALHALSRAHTVPGRMECFGGGLRRPLVVVDYAHTPDALEKALIALRAHCRGQLWCVFGCGGERDRGKRPQMGAIAARLAERVVLTDDNPRHEDGDAIIAEILTGISDSAHLKVERDRTRAVAYAIGAAVPGDVVLVAGKGHEADQIVGDRCLPYSDRDTVRGALEEGAA